MNLYTIKPLEWVPLDGPEGFKAATPLGNYVIDRWRNKWSTSNSHGDLQHDFDTIEAAKEFAQQHFEQNLSPALVPEPAPALQATQYLLARGTMIDWPFLAEYSISTGTWFVSHYETGFMNKHSGDWSTTEPVDHPDYSFPTAEEAAECFYRHYPHLKPQSQRQFTR